MARARWCNLTFAYVQRVFSSNVKGGFDVQLGPKTLLVGPSGSGKSAIVDALVSQLFGRIENLQGRATVVTPERQALVTDGELPDVEVFLSDEHAFPACHLYAETHDALLRAAVPALETLCGVPGVPPAVPAVLSVTELDAARAVLGVYYNNDPDLMPAPFLKWYASKREAACLSEDRVRDAARRTNREGWTARACAAKELCARASQWLPARMQPVVLWPGSPNVPGCSLGLGEPPVRYGLSGAEWVLAVSSLAVARARPGSLNLLLPADRAVDPGLLSDWMRALSPAPVQAIFQATVPPEPVPPGWLVIQFPLPTPGRSSRRPSASPKPARRLGRRATKPASRRASAAPRLRTEPSSGPSGTRRGSWNVPRTRP